MSLESHKGQILPLVNVTIPLSQTTTFYSSYDNNAWGYDVTKAIKPIGYSNALGFNGTNTYTTLDYGKGLVVEPMTIEAWVRPNGVALTQTLFGVTDSAGNKLSVGIASGKWDIAAGSSDYVTPIGTVNANALQWQHVALVLNSGVATIYVNGISTVTKSYTSFNLLSNITLGCLLGAASNTNFFDGAMSDLRIWSIVRTSTEILSTSNKELTGTETGLVRYFKLNQVEGTIIQDYSPNGSSCRVYGSAKWTYGITVATLKPGEGKIGGAIAVEEATTNLCASTDFSTGWVKSTDVTSMQVSYLPFVDRSLVPTLGFQYSGSGDGNVMYTIPTTMFGTGSYTLSFWIKCDTPNIPLYANCSLQESSGLYRNITATYTNATLPTEWTRVILSGTAPSDVASSARIIFRPTTSTTATVYYTMPQVEQKLFATSYANGPRPDGNLQYNGSMFNLAEGTVSCWIKPSSGYFTIAASSIFAHVTIGSNNLFQIYRYATTSQVAISIANTTGSPLGGSWGILKSTTNLIADNWYMITTKWKASTGEVYLYINGALEASITGQAMAGFPSTLGTVGIGMRPGASPGKSMNSVIDEVRIDKVMVSNDEITAWYQAGGPFGGFGSSKFIY